MGVGVGCLKIITWIFDFILFVFGVTLFAFGLYAKYGAKTKDFDHYIHDGVEPTWGLVIALGAFITIVSFLGCCGILMENKIMIYAYVGILAILAIVEFICIILAFVFRGKIDKTMDKLVEKQYDIAKSDEPGKEAAIAFFAKLSEMTHCCGPKNGGYDKLVEDRQCAFGQNDCRYCKGMNFAEMQKAEDCDKVGKEVMHGILLIIGGLTIGVLLIEIIAIGVGIFIAREIGR